MKELEIWADSFHEGVWCCDNICNNFARNGFTYTCSYEKGFVPHYILSKDGDRVLSITVYGSYRSWEPIPQKIQDLIDWGKPDFVAYDPDRDELLFACEETAATPTGNQAMQRCERQYGAAHLKLPYWYIVSEYGSHRDGHVRRDNIWPSIAAIKYSIIFGTPNIVLHYSDINNVEDYAAGNGLGLLFSALAKIINNFISDLGLLSNLEDELYLHYKEMTKFVLSQWRNVIEFLPSKDLLELDSTNHAIARFALRRQTANDVRLKDQLLVWPKTDNVPHDVLAGQRGKALIKFDRLALNLENDVTAHKCYILSANAGSGKPHDRAQLEKWINEQRTCFNRARQLDPPVNFNMRSEDFPCTGNGNNVHLTTSKNIVYLYDRWSDLRQSIEDAYPRLGDKTINIPDDEPVFVYVTNSIKKGRLFGDPFTGQLSAYSTAFGKFDNNKRYVLFYCPHQVHAQIFKNGRIEKNKGVTLFTELVDYMLFHEGVLVSLSTGEVL